MKRTICIVLSLLLLLVGWQQQPAPAPSAVSSEITTASSAPEAAQPAEILTANGRISALSCTDTFCVASVIGPDDHQKLVSVDLATQQVLGEHTLEFMGYDVFAFPGGIAVQDWNSMDLTVFSEKLETLWTRSSKELPRGEIQPDGCYYGIDENFDIVQLSLATQEEKRQHLPDGLEPTAIATAQDNQCLVEYYDADGRMIHRWLNMDSGEFIGEQPPVADAYYPIRGNYYQTYYGSDGTYLGNPNTDTVYALPQNNLTVLASTKNYALFYELDTGLLFWDLEQGTYWHLPTDYLWTTAICGDKVVYAEQKQPGTLYLWSPSSARPDGDTGKALTQDQLDEANRTLSADIEQKTGMKIFYGEDGTRFNGSADSGYASEPCGDPLLLHLGLAHISRLTQELPAGLFREMLPAGTDQLEVYLTGTISSTRDGQPPVCAFTSTLGERQVLAADLNYADTPNEFRATMVHEFMHMMESRINECAKKDNMPYLPYWMSFAPAKDAYVYSYVGEDGMMFWDSTYTASSDIPMEEVSFLDSYSRTFPEEDRARILENLYLGNDSSFPYKDVLRSGKMAEKAQYLCALIRHCFPSCQIDQKLPWETLVDTVPFSSYEEAVKNYQPTIGE